MESFPSPGGFGPTPSSVSAASSASKSKKKRGKGKGIGDEERPVTRRVITRTRAIAIFASVLAAGAVLVALQYNGAQTFVVYSTANVGALGELTPGDLEADAVPDDAVPADAFTGSTGAEALEAATAVIGERSRVQYPIYDGDVLRTENFKLGDSLKPVIPAPSQRLLSVTVSANLAVSGEIRAGDYVDVWTILENDPTPIRLKESVQVAKVSLSGDQLATASESQIDPEGTNRDRSVGEIVPADIIGGTYVLVLDDADVESFVLADRGGEGTIYLVYRDTPSTTTGTNATTSTPAS